MDDGRRRRALRALCGVGVPLLLVAGIVAASTVGDDDDPKPLAAGAGAASTTVPAPTTTGPPSATTTPVGGSVTTTRPGATSARVQVKFADGTDIRLRNGVLVSLTGKDLSALNQVLQRYPGAVARLFQRPEADLAAEKVAVEALTGKPQPDLNLWYVLTPGDPTKTDALIADLKRLAVVEQANRDPGAAPLPAPAP